MALCAKAGCGAPLGARALFLSQRPYLPLGELRGAVAYPGLAGPQDDARLADAMERVNLGHLAPRLGEAADWSRVLSIGEQQRLAFARVLYNRPAIVFLDEATSATDEGWSMRCTAVCARTCPRRCWSAWGIEGRWMRFIATGWSWMGRADGRWGRWRKRRGAGGLACRPADTTAAVNVAGSMANRDVPEHQYGLAERWLAVAFDGLHAELVRGRERSDVQRAVGIGRQDDRMPHHAFSSSSTRM